jgi:hypothetical protein
VRKKILFSLANSSVDINPVESIEKNLSNQCCSVSGRSAGQYCVFVSSVMNVGESGIIFRKKWKILNYHTLVVQVHDDRNGYLITIQ